jgi:eukaryotic-like serine/threonine-protein kinase
VPVQSSGHASTVSGVAVPEGVVASESPRAVPADVVPAGVADSQKTVISKRPPASTPVFVRAANPFEMGSALTGEMLGHFRLEEFVGGGGMGAVFRATDTMLGRTVAVKVVARDETNEETLRRFRNEAQSAARLDHPNIARVYYVGEDKGWNYIVFEYIEGVNVRDLVEHNGPLSLEDALKYTLQMSEALDHASQRDVIHRDIKPSNILIMVDGRAKLVDMGLARLHQVESPSEDLTASGVTLGTFDYISPEQARDPRNTDVRSDLYSLGCTLFFMLTAQPPFPEGTVLQKLLSHSGDEPPDVVTLRPDLPPDIAVVIRKMLAKSPEQRFQTPRDLIGELLLLADRLNLTAITTNSTIWLAPAQPKVAWWVRHMPWIAPVAVLAMVVLIQTWLDTTRDVPQPAPPRFAQRAEPAASADSGVRSEGEKQAQRKSPGESAPRAQETGADSNADSSANANAKTPAQAPDLPGKSGTPGAGSSGGAPEKAGASVAGAAAPQAAATTGSTPPPQGMDPAADSLAKPPATGVKEALKNGPVGADALTSPRAHEATTIATVPDDRHAAAASPHVLVVSDDSVPPDPGLLRVRSLEEAIDRAAELSTVDEIQLRFNGIHKLRSIDLDVDHFAQGKLTIRAADGFTPIIACEAHVDHEATAQPSAMIRLHGGRLTWRDTHFYFELPVETADLAPRSLFQLDAVDTVEFSRCSFTVRNTGLDGLPAVRPVTLFDLMPVDELAGLLYDLESLGQTPAIRLTNCAVRGQTTLVRSAEALPFWLSWDHGLFISSEQLVDVGGALVQPPWDMGRITLGLKRLLVFADRGICQVHTDSNAPYPAGITVKSQACLFATRLTKPPTPLYLVRAAGPRASNDNQLLISGSNNFYKNTRIVLRVEASADHNLVEEYSFDDLRERPGQTWFTERNPLPATVFSWLPPARSADRQQLDDYVAPTGGDGWFMEDLEIEPGQLPRFPDYSSLVPRADLRLPPAHGEPSPSKS